MIELMFRSFGAKPPRDLGAGPQAVLWLAAVAFVVISLLILAVLNLFSFFLFGVIISFLGQEGVGFRFVHVFRRIPLIAVTTPVLFFHAAWIEVQANGLLSIIGATLLTAGLAVVLLACAVAVNSIGRSG